MKSTPSVLAKCLLQWRGNKALNQFGIGADIGGFNFDKGSFDLRIFTYFQPVERGNADQQDQQADYSWPAPGA